MKILAVGRNYAEHIKELSNEKPDEPVIFSKPETALLKNNEPFYYPDFSTDIHHEVEVVIKISKMGKNIEEQFAHKYYEEIGLGIDFTARDIQSKLKSKGLPWDLAKGFNDSAPVSEFVSKSDYDLSNLNFSLDINGERKQTGNTSLMLFSFDYLISFISRYFTLKTGDLIFTGTPSGVSPVKTGDHLTGHLENKLMFDFEVK
ncbi:2-hydroxyhepta-2,4-diene-1,7-dioate isomerase [Emticicia sp. CRIBPO]|uniref:fumarylacetoacetate hydrolase family protein n=1 Tax=Emticicia sp. CRIBPO TaxID=2683258 RepID=UPI001411BF54|nr:fumarylacetoacetate hydrolase family protein [Emticicia sp. CRIBPO]NBA84176.1 2-hydroxyhepta-2,4-diene-1,7-dioate isomerase [Emticicia sp. CRIBPO]